MPRIKKLKPDKQTMTMHTKNPGHLCEIEWKIDNVLEFPNETFTSKLSLSRGCRTHLNILVRIKENDGYSDFYLGYERTDEQTKHIRVVFDLKLVNSKGDVYMLKKVKFSPKSAQKFQQILKIRFADPDYFESATKLTENELQEEDDDVLKNLVSLGLVIWDQESLHKLYSLPDDSITVKGSVKVFACCVPLKVKPIKSSSDDIPQAIDKSGLIDNLQSAFISEMESGKFSDVTLWIQGEPVHAHKFILSARCPKFKKLLEPDYEGGISANEFVIEGIEKSVFVHFLHYLYTGRVGIVKWGEIEKLYEIAIEYKVDSLLEKCKRTLISVLKDSKACRALLFADKHKDEDLKKATINFIKGIYFRFKNTIYWISFRDDNPGLATEVMNSVIDSI